MTTILTEMGEKPEGQRPTSGRRVAEPAAYLTVIRGYADQISHQNILATGQGLDNG